MCTNVDDRRLRKLDARTVRRIRDDYAAGRASQAALAKRYNVSLATVNSIVHRRTWAWLD